MTLVKRLVKGSALTFAEADGNLDHFTDAIALKADLEAELISGGETTVDGTTVTVAAATWRVPPSTYATVTDTDFTSIANSATGMQRYVAFYGTTSNTITKEEGSEDVIAVLPTQPADTALISYVLVGDAGIGTPTQDTSGFQLKADKDQPNGYVGLTALKINFYNTLGTFKSFLTNAATAARTYTFPNKDIAVAGLDDIKFEIGLACSDESTDLTTGTAKVTFRMPAAITITQIYASVNTAPTGSSLVVDINESGASILSTKLSIDASEKTSTTAATPYVLSDSILALDSEITIDIDQIGSTIAGKGLKVTIIGTRN